MSDIDFHRAITQAAHNSEGNPNTSPLPRRGGGTGRGSALEAEPSASEFPLRTENQEPKTENPAQHPTPEEALFARYMQLGELASNAKAERENLRETEIEPLLDSGVVIGDTDKCLVYEFQTRVSFDYARARKEGAISDEVWRDYTEVSVTRGLYARKKDEDQRSKATRLNLIRKAAPLLFEALTDAIPFLNPQLAPCLDELEAATAAIKLATEAPNA